MTPVTVRQEMPPKIPTGIPHWKHAMRLITLIPTFVLALIAGGCGGGSGGSGGSQEMGRVTMLIGDAPIQDLTEVWITVSEVELNMTGGKKDVVLNPPQRIDLLRLQNLTEVLLSEEIVSGRINKVRLLLDNTRDPSRRHR